MLAPICSNCPQMLEDLQARVSFLVSENKTLKAKNQNLEQDYQTIIKELKSFAEQVIDLSAQTRILDHNTNKEKLNSQIKYLQDLKEQVKQTESYYAELKKRISLKESEIIILERENIRLREGINRLGAQQEQHEVEKNVINLGHQRSSTNEEMYTLKYKNDKIAPEQLREYYDCRINADSFYTLLKDKTWLIDYNNYNQYTELAKKSTTKVAVLGYENTGKSFLLSKLTGSELPQGTLTKTVGLCLKYPTDESRPWTALDTPGTNISVKTEEMKEKLSVYFEQKGLSSEDTMRLLLGDNILMENLLQQFVVQHAQVLLVVIGRLQRDDQRLINRIKLLPGKRIIIVHNLMDACNKKDVEELIDLDIRKTFPVTERQFYLEKGEEGKGKGMNCIVYLENDEKKDDRAVEHIVLAHEGSAAGNYYNESAYYYIKTLITSMPFVKPFDLAKSFLEYLNENFRNYLQPKNSETVNPFSFEKDEKGVPKTVMLQDPLQYDLKLSSADEFGQIRTFVRGGLEDIPYTVKIVQPAPNAKSDVKAVLRVEIEIAGKYENTDIKYKLLPQNNQARIEIRGKSEDNTKRGENEQILETRRKFGDFNFFTEPIDLEKLVINPREKCNKISDEVPGLMILSWNLYEPAEDS